MERPTAFGVFVDGATIVHDAKVTVSGYGMAERWDEPVGLPVEILPLVRPYHPWEGNPFRGVVLRDGEPVPFAGIEVEWRNDGTLDAARLSIASQVIEAAATGAFAFAMPRAGWWGFAALVDGDQPIVGADGESWDVEPDGLAWAHARSVE